MTQATLGRSRWLGLIGAMIVAHAFAQDVYPSKPIRPIIPYPPGGVVDVRGRELAERLLKYLHQPVIVENRPGAGGAIGIASVAKAPPDGYTLLIAASSQMVFEPLLNANVAYDPDRDFLPVAGVTPMHSAAAAAIPVALKGMANSMREAHGATR